MLRKKRIILPTILLTSLFTFSSPVSADNGYINYEGGSQDSYEQGNFISQLCPTCQNVYRNEDDNASKLVLKYTTTDEEGNEITIDKQFYVVSETSYERLSSLGALPSENEGDYIILPDDDLPNILNDDGTTNSEYHDSLNDWRNKAIVNGKLDSNHKFAQAVASVYCKDYVMGESISDSCMNYIGTTVADNPDDLVDAVIYPCLATHTQGQSDDSLKCVDKYDACNNRDLPGVNEVMCNVQKACQAGTDASGLGVTAGQVGACTWDSTADLFGIPKLTCEEKCISMCTYAGDKFDICNADCLKNLCDKPTGDDDDDDDDDDDIPTGLTCSNIKNPKPYIGTIVPTEQVTPATCQSPNFFGKYFSKTAINGCPSDANIYLITETNISVSAPGAIKGTNYSGKGFNWGGFSGSATVNKYIVGTENLDIYRYNNLEVAKHNADVVRCNCKAGVSANESSCKGKAYDAEKKCETDYEGDAEKIEECKSKISSCDYSGAYYKCESDYNTTISAIDKNVKKVEETIAACNAAISAIDTTSQTYNNIITQNDAVMTIGNYSQTAGSVKWIEKNTANPLTLKTENSYENIYDFFIPVPTTRVEGIVSQTATATVNDVSATVSSSCPLEAVPYYDQKVIYRPISLTTPFPNTNDSDEYRKMLGYWNEGTANFFVKNNREVADYQIYGLQPMYTIILTPSAIKEIRQYNDKHSYSDFNMKCEDGLYCKSDFLRTTISHMIDYEKSCAMSNEWYACDSDYYATARDQMLDRLKK